MPQIPEESKEHLTFTGLIYLSAKTYEDQHRGYDKANTEWIENTKKDMKTLQLCFDSAQNKSKLQNIAEMTRITQQREVDVWNQKMDKYKE